MSKPKTLALKPMPYWCKNHYIDYAYKLCGDWYTSVNSVVAKDIVERAPFKFCKDVKIAEVNMKDNKIIETIESFVSATDLVPVVDKTLTTLEPLDCPQESDGGVDVNQLIWELIILPPAPGWEVFPGAFKKTDGLGVAIINPILLGWTLYRLQSIDEGLDWQVSYSGRVLYLKKEEKIQAVLCLCSWEDLGDGELWETGEEGRGRN